MEDYKKKYEEALKNLKKIRNANGNNKELVDFIEYKYPELKESKDERIKRTLINFLDDVWHLGKNANFDKYGKADCTEWIAWLKKQDPKKHEEELEKAYKTADEVQYKKGFEDAKREFEKQGEQKPAWSGEDSSCYDDICEILINLIYNPKSNVNKDVVQRDLNWIMSIKEKICS